MIGIYERGPGRAGARIAALSGFALAALLAASAGAQEPAERQVTLQDQTDLAITIYNQDLALVRDSRRMALEAGRNRLALLGLSRQIRPETALLGSAGADFSVIEQSFRPGLLSPARLLEEYVGKTVSLVRTDPRTGADRAEEALLLSAAGPVLRIGDRVEIDPPGRIVLPGVPDGLWPDPALTALVDSRAARTTPAELRYLTGGLSWQADYVAELDDEKDRIGLKGWITLTNGSGTAYRDAHLSLVAGDVNQVRPYMMAKAEAMVMGAAAAPAPARVPLADYHLYRLDRPVTLARDETRQVALLAAADVPVKKEYRFANLNGGYDYRSGEAARVSAAVRVSFENTEAAGLGLPLPQGTVRVYGGGGGKNGGEADLFLGEDRIGHTPKGETVRLTLGRAFDVTARSRQTAFERLGERSIETAFAVEFKNAKAQPVTVTLTEQIPGEWKILQESHRHERVNAQQAQWSVPVPANGTAELTYRVRVTY